MVSEIQHQLVQCSLNATDRRLCCHCAIIYILSLFNTPASVTQANTHSCHVGSCQLTFFIADMTALHNTPSMWTDSQHTIEQINCFLKISHTLYVKETNSICQSIQAMIQVSRRLFLYTLALFYVCKCITQSLNNKQQVSLFHKIPLTAVR